MTRNRILVLDGLPPGAVLVAAAATTSTAILALLIGIALPILPRLLVLPDPDGQHRPGADWDYPAGSESLFHQACS